MDPAPFEHLASFKFGKSILFRVVDHFQSGIWRLMLRGSHCPIMIQFLESISIFSSKNI